MSPGTIGSEDNMKNRIYQYADRFLMKDVDGMNPKEVIIERVKGIVTQEGTPLNKATLLSDEAAGMLGVLVSDPTPNDAFLSIAAKLREATKSDYAQGIVGTEAGYTDVYGSIGLVSDVIGGSGITHSNGSFTIVDTAIKAVRITAGGRYVPADGAGTYVGYNRVSKNGTPVLYESFGYCSGGGSAMWQISGIVPVTQGDVFTLQGKGSVSGKVRRAVGTNLSLEAIYV